MSVTSETRLIAGVEVTRRNEKNQPVTRYNEVTGKPYQSMQNVQIDKIKGTDITVDVDSLRDNDDIEVISANEWKPENNPAIVGFLVASCNEDDVWTEVGIIGEENAKITQAKEKAKEFFALTYGYLGPIRLYCAVVVN